MIHILLSQAGGYRDVIEHLQAAGARVSNLGPGPNAPGVFRGKLGILASMFSRRLWQARKLWSEQDRVLVIGWQAVPVLLGIRLGLFARPQRLLVMSCFVHSGAARAIVNTLWRLLKIPGLGFIVFSPGEARNLEQNVGISPANIVHHLWRQQLDGAADARSDDGSIFTGGYSNRDYDLLLDAAQDLPAPLVIVASSRNQFRPAGPNAVVHRDLPESEFEALLARSRVVAIPLRSTGEACGQSVVLRAMRNGKPLIATRHESIEDYLGSDYPGFVRQDDTAAMRAALMRAISDEAYRAELASIVRAADLRLAQRGSPGREIEQALLA